MLPFSFISILVFLILLACIIFLVSKINFLNHEIANLQKEQSETEKEFSSDNAYNQKLKRITDQKKQKILALFANGAKISNSQVAKALGVANVTALR